MSKLSRERLCSYTLTLALGLSALGAGAIHLAILAPFTLLVILSTYFAASQQPADGRAVGFGRRASVAIALCFALALFCLLQCVPLPLGLLEVLAHDNADVWSRALRPFGLPPPSTASISLAPGRTVLEALKAANYGLVLAISVQLGKRGGMRQMASIAFAITLLVAFVTAGHQLTGADRLYGTYRPLDAYSVAPLLNSNSRAGYLNLGFFCGLGLLFRAGTRPSAALLGLGLVFLAAEILLCASLGGTGCWAIGLLLVLVLPRGKSLDRESSELGRPLQGAILCAIAAGAGVLAWTARNSALGLGDRSVEKLELFSRSWQLAKDHLPLGIGRGAFASVFGAYQDTGRHVIAEHAENLPLQWAAEWGLPVAAAALAALAWVLGPLLSRRARGTPTRRCAIVGCGMVLGQNLFDLGLELPAFAALLCAVLGALLGSALQNGRRERLLPYRAAFGVGSVVALICLGLALKFGVPSAGRLRHQLHDELAAARGSAAAEFWGALERAIVAYPAEPYFPLLGASAALSSGQEPLPWITRVLERNPSSAQAYLQLGQILQAGHATTQALSALRRSIELDPRQTRPILDLAARWGLSADMLRALVPDGAAGAEVLALLVHRTQDVRLRVQLLEQSLERNPNQPDVHYELAVALLEDIERKEGGIVCATQREPCLARSAEQAELGTVAGNSRTVLLQARLLVERGQRLEAEEHVAKECQRFPGDLKCSTALVYLALGNSSARLSDAVQALIAVACTDRQRCGAAHFRLGNRFAGANRWNTALDHYQRAVQETPSPTTWRAVAIASERLGLTERAADARRRIGLLESAEARHPATSAPGPSALPAPSDDEPPASSD